MVNYLLIALASVIGILILALRIQGGRLHAAQIRLLVIATEQRQAKLDAAVIAAKLQLNASLKAYYEAGGKK